MWHTLLPAVVVAVTAVAGGLGSGSTALGSAVTLAMLVAVVALSRGVLLAPFGPASAAPMLALVVAVGIGTLTGEVPRAALEWVPLFFAVLVVPTLLVEACGVGEACGSSRRRTGVALGLVGAGLGVWALADATRYGGEVAMPLGHHALLATVLVVLWPIGWQACGPSAALRLVVVAPTVAAILGSHSLVALVAVAVQVVLLTPARYRIVVGGAAVVGAAGLGWARWTALAAGADASGLARLRYWQAAFEGWLDAPWFGHGLGSVPWLLGRYRPGVGGEVVGDVHSLPLGLLFETGAVGVAAMLLLVGSAWAFGHRRGGGGQAGVPAGPVVSPAQRDWARWAPLVGACLCLAVGPVLGAPAVLLALAVAVGWGRGAAPAGRPSRRPWIGPAVAGALALALVPSVLAAHRLEVAVDLAANSDLDEAARLRVAVAAAAALDPHHPLARWHLALLDRDVFAASDASRAADGVGILTLAAGAIDPAHPVGRRALERAVARDPDDPFGRYLLAQVVEDEGVAASHLAVALVREPRLIAAPSLTERPRVRRAAIRSILADETLEPGWRTDFAAAVRATKPVAADGFLRRTLDTEAATSVSLLLFRRQPWPLAVVAIAVDHELAVAVGLPPAPRSAESVSRRPR